MIKKSFSYIGIFFLNFLSALPMPVLYFFATLGYYFIYYILGYRRKVVRQNLVDSFPEKSLEEIIRIEQKFFRYFSDLVFEIIKMPSISESELLERVKFNNLEIVTQYYNSGQSLLACTGHYGNWEWGMLALGLKMPHTGHVIYKPLNNEYFDNWFIKMRSRFSNVMVPMKKTLRELSNTKNELTMFCFAGDQTPVKKDARHWINFLHQSTPVLIGLEKIALKTNRPVVYFDMRLIKRGHYEVDCMVLYDKPAATQEYEITKGTFNVLENIIKEEPAYWLWSHRRWKYKPDN